MILRIYTRNVHLRNVVSPPALPKYVGIRHLFLLLSLEVTARAPSRNGALRLLCTTERVEVFVPCRIRLLSFLSLLIQWYAERGLSSSSKSDVRLWKHA